MDIGFAMGKLFDKYLGWHAPTKKQFKFGPLTMSSCKYCGKKEIQRDSQGNWF